VSAPEPGNLLSAAESIANGASVDWDRLRSSADKNDGAVLRELQALERVAAFHRSSDPSEGVTVERDARPQRSHGSWGRFALLELLGEGTFGSVYRARDPNLQTDVALKLVTLPAERVAHPKSALKEARLLARVRHANVVTVYGADVIDGNVGIWMEFVEGETLSALLRARGSFGAREAALIGVDLCQALAAVHRAGLLHGDVKARNVMRAAGGRTVLMDFGTGRDLRSQTSHGRGSDLAGTPLYLAPEVFRGEERSKLGDIYSLGVLLYHLVTSAYPVDGRTLMDLEAAHARSARTPLRDVRPDLPAEFVAAVERALATDASQRFPSVGAFETALTKFLGLGHDAPAPGPRQWWRVAAAVAIVAALGGWAYWNSRRSGAPTRSASVTGEAPQNAAAPAATYRIDLALYRRRLENDTRLRSGDVVAPGDQVFATLRVSAPTYVYIVNEDDRGESYLLFPLPGQAIGNPIAPGASARIPGMTGKDVNWQITSAGGREHFLVFASAERLEAFEELFATLPRPTFGNPIASAKLSDQALGKLRGVGGLTGPPAQTSGRLANIFKLPLGDAEETARGLWVRILTVENPLRQ